MLVGTEVRYRGWGRGPSCQLVLTLTQATAGCTLLRDERSFYTSISISSLHSGTTDEVLKLMLQTRQIDVTRSDVRPTRPTVVRGDVLPVDVELKQARYIGSVECTRARPTR